MLGLEIADLVAAGWIGFAACIAARTTAHRYQRARWAMLDEMRRWYGVQRVGTGRRGGAWVRPTFAPIPHDLATAAVDPPLRLSPGQADDLRAACARLLSPRSAELMIGLLLEGESLELLAERQGRTREAAAVARSQAIATLRRALAA
jgi:hypothetical protein